MLRQLTKRTSELVRAARLRGVSQRPIHEASDDPTADTHPAAAAVMDALWRAMPGEEKLALADRWSRELIELSLVGLAQRYPNDSREQLELRAAHVRYGRELMERLTGTRFDW